METIYEDIFKKRFNKEQFLKKFSPVGTDKHMMGFTLFPRRSTLT